MAGYVAFLGAAIAVFVSTNVDNFVVLLAFFGDGSSGDAEVVVGQYLGMTALVGVSLVGSRAALLLPHATIGLLGLIPIALGLARLRASDEDGRTARRPEARLRVARVLSVAATAVGSGGDNVAAYVPLFALLTGGELAGSLVVFALLTGLWCLVARSAVAQPATGALVRRFGRPLVATVMIGLGIVILVRAGTVAQVLGR